MPYDPMKRVSTKAGAIIFAIAALAGAIVPPIVSVLKTPSVSVSNGGIAAGRDVNVFVSAADRWIDGVQTLLGTDRQEAGRSGEATVVRSGHFEFKFQPVEISPAPGSKPNGALQATLGLEIKNLSASPVRLAVVPEWPTLQAEGGIQFRLRGRGITGVESYNRDEIDNCPTAASNFSLLRPGQSISSNFVFDTDLEGREIRTISWARVSGSLMVESESEKKCWKEPFAASRVQTATFLQ